MCEVWSGNDCIILLWCESLLMNWQNVSEMLSLSFYEIRVHLFKFDNRLLWPHSSSWLWNLKQRRLNHKFFCVVLHNQRLVNRLKSGILLINCFSIRYQANIVVKASWIVSYDDRLRVIQRDWKCQSLVDRRLDWWYVISFGFPEVSVQSFVHLIRTFKYSRRHLCDSLIVLLNLWN